MCVLKLSSASRAVLWFMRFHDTRRTCINNKEAFVIYLRLAGNRLGTNHFPADVHTQDKRFWAVERARAREPYKIQINYEREPELEQIKWN